jgi:hypothetical protein
VDTSYAFSGIFFPFIFFHQKSVFHLGGDGEGSESGPFHSLSSPFTLSWSSPDPPLAISWHIPLAPSLASSSSLVTSSDPPLVYPRPSSILVRSFLIWLSSTWFLLPLIQLYLIQGELVGMVRITSSFTPWLSVLFTPEANSFSCPCSDHQVFLSLPRTCSSPISLATSLWISLASSIL